MGFLTTPRVCVEVFFNRYHGLCIACKSGGFSERRDGCLYREFSLAGFFQSVRYGLGELLVFCFADFDFGCLANGFAVLPPYGIPGAATFF